jgi:hypothetical protein
LKGFKKGNNLKSFKKKATKECMEREKQLRKERRYGREKT